MVTLVCTAIRFGGFPALARSFRTYSRLQQSSSTGHLPGHPSSPYLSSFQNAVFDSINANGSSAANLQDNGGGGGKVARGIPTYRLMDGNGNLLPGVQEEDLQLQKEEAVKMIRNMLLLPALDVILYNAQRQGRISFMMTSHGEEAAVIGSASALDPKDEVFAQYREMGVLLYRGYNLNQVMSQVRMKTDNSLLSKLSDKFLLKITIPFPSPSFRSLERRTI